MLGSIHRVTDRPSRLRAQVGPDRSPADPQGPGGPGRSRARGWVWVLSLAAFVVYAAYALSRHRQFLTAGHDLGIFDQAVRAYSRFAEPLVPLKGSDFNILGDHFHPILLAVVPAYWAFDDPRTLLVIQALLLAASIPVVHAFALRRMPSGWALALSAGYALGWPLAAMVDFDFHEAAFAVPVLALAIDALDRRSDRALIAWSLVLLLVREDMGAVVLLLGALRALHRPRRVGVGLMLAGVAAFLVVTQLVIPAMSSTGTFVYWTFDALGPDLPSSIRHLVTQPWDVARAFVTPAVKVGTLALLLVPLSLLPLGSPYALLALPLLAERFLNSRERLWTTDFHYDAPIWIILTLAMVDAGGRWGVWRRPTLRSAAIGWLIVSQVLLIAVGQSPLRRVVDGSAWRTTPHAQSLAQAVATIPPGVCVAVDDRLAPHLTRTNRVTRPGVPAPTADYIAVDLTQATVGHDKWPSVDVLRQAQADGYVTVWVSDGIHVLALPTVTPRPECQG